MTRSRTEQENDEPESCYTREFYEYKKGWTHQSADFIVGKLLEFYRPNSAIDIGCGTGTWLTALKDHGVKDTIGVDGDYVNADMLEIPREEFIPYDLSTPFSLDRQFDLAISLEVAEHLYENVADSFVRSLTQLAPVVLFSAAIPHQGGVHHVNEQWQSHWAEKFRELDYLPIDAIRKATWAAPEVAAHYPQNILLYVSADILTDHPQLATLTTETDIPMLDVVHPKRYIRLAERIARLEQSELNLKRELEGLQDPNNISLAKTLTMLPLLIRKAIQNRISSGNAD